MNIRYSRCVRALAAVAVLFLALAFVPAAFPAAAATYIDNRDLMPKYVADGNVEMRKLYFGEGDDAYMDFPAWGNSLIMTELRIETATPEGTFQAAQTKVLEHYAEMGVNGLWITPIYDRSGKDPRSNGYGNFGPETVWGRLTGCDNYEDSWEVVKAFVQRAHELNIYIFFDLVAWGCDYRSPIATEHPEWFTENSPWGGWAYSFFLPKFKEWFISSSANVLLRTGADGFRVDLAPDTGGYDPFEEIIYRCWEAGRDNVMLFSEIPNERLRAFAFEQFGVGVDDTQPNHYTYYHNYFTTHENIVNACKTGRGVGSLASQNSEYGGTYTWYTFCLSNHDNHADESRGNRVAFGYEAIFAPFIPLWYIGSEWNNTWSGMCFTDVIDWDKLDEPANRAFYEDVKKMIRIRRSYPDIFEYWPDNHRATNICDVVVDGQSGGVGDAYARYADGRGFVIVANTDGADKKVTVEVPLEKMGISDVKNATYTVTEMMSGKLITSGSRAAIAEFEATIPAGSVAAFFINDGISRKTTAPTTKVTKKTVKTTVTKASTTAPTTTPTTTEITTEITTEATTTAPTEITEPVITEEPITTEPTTEKPSGGFPMGALIGIIAAGVVLVAAGVVTLIVLKKKKSA